MGLYLTTLWHIRPFYKKICASFFCQHLFVCLCLQSVVPRYMSLVCSTQVYVFSLQYLGICLQSVVPRYMSLVCSTQVHVFSLQYLGTCFQSVVPRYMSLVFSTQVYVLKVYLCLCIWYLCIHTLPMYTFAYFLLVSNCFLCP